MKSIKAFLLFFLIAMQTSNCFSEDEILTLSTLLHDRKECQLYFGNIEEVLLAKQWRTRVYLATYPRSGNHWLRYLIEEATGIATSSVYLDPDPPHLNKVFPWGGYTCNHGYEGNRSYPQEVAVVKTHFPAMIFSRFDQLPYSKTIRIIRHPIDSFYSFYRWLQQYGFESKESPFSRERLIEFIKSWRRFQEYWDCAENVLTLRYEDLYETADLHLQLILQTIGYDVSATDIARAVSRYPASGGILKHKDYFSAEELSLIRISLGDLLEKYGYEMDRILPLSQLLERSQKR